VPAADFIEAILESDRKAPRKQRHTAHRIWCRLRVERPELEIAESGTCQENCVSIYKKFSCGLLKA